MPEHVSILIWFGVVLPAVLVIVCAIGLAGYRFGLQFEIRRRHRVPGLPALPSQRGSGPHREYVELTPAERAAFAGLMRQLGDGH
ncbi:hypothetical protein ACWDSD_17050 [Streptomyces spiralis]|uniref:Uncharacterized protein n=1 Tax=Streptomyces spiralis TaxID=66376 RepID=A0A918ZU78_9ACTN|nr:MULTISPECIES: hypothetical protein [Streptomyces]GHE70795.1 hypothetical protein GCM10014715_26110 [Streptomyces spiralis]